MYLPSNWLQFFYGRVTFIGDNRRISCSVAPQETEVSIPQQLIEAIIRAVVQV
jgi:hypothetical protein